MRKPQTLIISDQLYEIIRVLPESFQKHTDLLKEYFIVDKVFKKDGNLYFCRFIAEAELVDDTLKIENNDTEQV